MKIGYVLAAPPGYSETFFNNLFRLMSGTGHNVYLFTNTGRFSMDRVKHKSGPLGGSRLVNTFNVLTSLAYLFICSPRRTARFIGLERKSGKSTGRALINLIASAHIISENLDWIHFGFATMAIGRESLGEAMGAKTATSIRGFDISIYPLKHPKCYQLLWETIDRVHVISDAVRLLAVEDGLAPDADIRKITPAINTNKFRGGIRKAVDCRPMNIVTVARLHWMKGLDYTLEALALLSRENIPFTYTVVGEGPEKERLVFACHQLGISQKVHFVGKLPHKEVKDQLINSNIYVQYSVQEGFGNAVLEAQALGLLCVVSDAGGLSENVLNNQTGWVIPKRKPELLAKKLKELLHLSDESKRSVTKKAIQRVMKEFNLEKHSEAFLSFYH